MSRWCMKPPQCHRTSRRRPPGAVEGRASVSTVDAKSTTRPLALDHNALAREDAPLNARERVTERKVGMATIDLSAAEKSPVSAAAATVDATKVYGKRSTEVRALDAVNVA